MALSEIALTPSSCLRGFFPPRPSEQAWRMFHGVAEGAPGVTIDKYGSTLFVQSWRAPIVRLLGACYEYDWRNKTPFLCFFQSHSIPYN